MWLKRLRIKLQVHYRLVMENVPAVYVRLTHFSDLLNSYSIENMLLYVYFQINKYVV